MCHTQVKIAWKWKLCHSHRRTHVSEWIMFFPIETRATKKKRDSKRWNRRTKRENESLLLENGFVEAWRIQRERTKMLLFTVCLCYKQWHSSACSFCFGPQNVCRNLLPELHTLVTIASFVWNFASESRPFFFIAKRRICLAKCLQNILKVIKFSWQPHGNKVDSWENSHFIE